MREAGTAVLIMSICQQTVPTWERLLLQMHLDATLRLKEEALSHGYAVGRVAGAVPAGRRAGGLLGRSLIIPRRAATPTCDLPEVASPRESHSA